MSLKMYYKLVYLYCSNILKIGDDFYIFDSLGYITLKITVLISSFIFIISMPNYICISLSIIVNILLHYIHTNSLCDGFEHHETEKDVYELILNIDSLYLETKTKKQNIRNIIKNTKYINKNGDLLIPYIEKRIEEKDLSVQYIEEKIEEKECSHHYVYNNEDRSVKCILCNMLKEKPAFVETSTRHNTELKPSEVFMEKYKHIKWE